MRAVQLLTFMEYCSSNPLEKDVLECGAGVWDSSEEPLFVRFYKHGYRVHGIEISPERVEAAQAFCQAQQIEADLRQGDMRELPFDDKSMSFIFSYNTIFHMSKLEVGIAIKEIQRILKPEGLCFVNFLSVESDTYGVGEEIRSGEFLEHEAGEDRLHCYFKDGEADRYFDGFELLYKEKRVREWLGGGKRRIRGYIDYIVKAK